MEEKEFEKLENQISKIVVDVCYQIHRDIGPGLFESVYEEILFTELKEWGFRMDRQKLIPVKFKNQFLEKAFKADIVIADAVILEIKSVEAVFESAQDAIKNIFKTEWVEIGVVDQF